MCIFYMLLIFNNFLYFFWSVSLVKKSDIEIFQWVILH